MLLMKYTEVKRHILKKKDLEEATMKAWNSPGNNYLKTLIKSMKHRCKNVLENKRLIIN